jgi:hypothetical protein
MNEIETSEKFWRQRQHVGLDKPEWKPRLRLMVDAVTSNPAWA